MLNILGINLKVENINCKHCNMQNVNFFEHAECCKKSRKRKTHIDGQVIYKFPTRSWPLHAEIERHMASSFVKIPDVTITEHNPKLSANFPPNELNPPNVVPPEANDENMDPLIEEDAPAAVPQHFHRRERGQEYADLKLTCTFPQEPSVLLIDLTVSGIHTETNKKYTMDPANKYSSCLPAQGEHKKILKHAKYMHDGKAIGYAMDSMGGISEGATNITNHLYAKGTAQLPRRWLSDNMRCALKKEYLDTLSSILTRHRVLDYTRMGLPNARLNQRQLQQPHQQAQGGANNINNVNNNGNRRNLRLAAQ